MHRSLLLLLFLASACARREVGSGEWTGVTRPDAALSTVGPARDEGAPGKGATDAAAPPPPFVDSPDASAGGGFAPPPDASPRGGPEAAPGALEPVAPPMDASSDVGDARSCPESGQCD